MLSCSGVISRENTLSLISSLPVLARIGFENKGSLILSPHMRFVEDVSYEGAIMSTLYRKYAWMVLRDHKGCGRRPKTSTRPSSIVKIYGL